MLHQLIKIMWHRRGKNFLLLVEIFFSFVVLFAASTFIIEGLRNYLTPTGFDYKDVFVLSIETNGEGGASIIEKIKQIKREAQLFPEVASLSLSSNNTPYSFNGHNGTIRTEGDEKPAFSHYFFVEPSYLKTMDLELQKGRFLKKGDMGKVLPAVINDKLQSQLFPDEDPLGKRLNYAGQLFEVVGVVKHFRQAGEFMTPVGGLFHLADLSGETNNIPSRLLIKIKPGAGMAWQPQLMDKVAGIAGNWTFEINSLAETRADRSKFTIIPVIALSTVCGFLIFNVVLGLFGVLWHNINKRYSEIGIRRAVGATKGAVRFQMVGEVMVLATFGIILGFLLAVQFPILGVFNVDGYIYLAAMLSSLILIYMLVAFCAWYPSRQASKIEPAEALHYE